MHEYPDDPQRFAHAVGELPPSATGRALLALLAWAPDRARETLDSLSDTRVADALGGLSPPLGAAVTRLVREPRRTHLLTQLPAEVRGRLEARLRWPDDSLGALAHDDIHTTGPRLHAALPLERAVGGPTRAVVVHDDAGHVLGAVWRDEVVWLLGQRSAAREGTRARAARGAVVVTTALALAAAAVLAATLLR